MQTDAWLTETSYPDRCPLCNRPLPGGSNTCLSCGFTAHESASASASQPRPQSRRRSNPVTPIPARASARRVQSSPGGPPRRVVSAQSTDQASAQQAEGWQHESSNYQAVSSLSALSLIISETPTAPPRPQRRTERLAHIDEIDTVPQLADEARPIQQASHQEPDIAKTPDASEAVPTLFAALEAPKPAPLPSEITPPAPVSHIDEIDTVPEVNRTSFSASSPHSCAVPVNATSWTADSQPGSSLTAQLVASRFPLRRRNFNPLDHTRWWLLRPGHIEFFLWLVGSLLLFGITFVILLATVLSMMLPGQLESGNLPTSTVTAITATSGSTTAIASNPGAQQTAQAPTRGTGSPPTSGTTITPVRSAGTSSSSQGQNGGSPGLGNSLSKDDSSFFTRLVHLNPLVWVIGACYIASMLLLGFAGVLYRRRR